MKIVSGTGFNKTDGAVIYVVAVLFWLKNRAIIALRIWYSIIRLS